MSPAILTTQPKNIINIYYNSLYFIVNNNRTTTLNIDYQNVMKFSIIVKSLLFYCIFRGVLLLFYYISFYGNIIIYKIKNSPFY
jgi:hypothetical protein